MIIAGFPAGSLQTNCWVLATGAGEQCVIIDPGEEAVDQLENVLDKYRLSPAAVVLTHGHFDHTLSVYPVCQARDIPAYIHPQDRSQLTNPWDAIGVAPGTPICGQLTFTEPDDVREMEDNTVLDLVGINLTVRHAPGHTPGSVIFTTETTEEQYMFSGDLLFNNGIGRYDLPGGSREQMGRSLSQLVLPAHDDMIVHPGHGPSTTIGQERHSNSYLKHFTGLQSYDGNGSDSDEGDAANWTRKRPRL